MNGINFFIIFWSTNYKKFGGKNGVLGIVYLAGVLCVMGFFEWAWSKWDQDIENWWLNLIGEKKLQWDVTILSLITILGWVVALKL